METVLRALATCTEFCTISHELILTACFILLIDSLLRPDDLTHLGLAIMATYCMKTILYEIAIAHEYDSVPYRAWSFMTIGGSWWLQVHMSMLSWFRFNGREASDWPFWGSCMAFIVILSVFIYLKMVGLEELYYILLLPAKIPRVFRLVLRAGPRFVHRYGTLWMAKETIEGSVLSWWANDLLEEIMVQTSN